ncbi:MAG: hypothetical protein H0U50_13890 [Pyrinomonadaceae bacterium]|nr:hypothetical protein [Pyrinomonadaceae bacterium]
MIDFELVIKSLTTAKVDFVIIGEIASLMHGWKTAQMKLEFCYLRTSENLRKIVGVFATFNPRLRGFPEDLPFVWDERTLQNGKNFTLKTAIGDIDLLDEVAGVGDFEAVKKESVVTILYDCEVRVLTLEGLIKAKRAAGRTKDLLVLPELEALQELPRE